MDVMREREIIGKERKEKGRSRLGMKRVEYKYYCSMGILSSSKLINCNFFNFCHFV